MYKEEQRDVYYVSDDFISLSEVDLRFLKDKLPDSPKGRVRLCMHQSVESKMQEMLIALAKGVYIRPHKHMNKPESQIVVEGEADLLMFNDCGRLLDVVRLAANGNGKFYYRLNQEIFHMLVVKSETFIVCESTIGPFNVSDTTYPEWSPSEQESKSVQKFMGHIYKLISMRRV